MDLHQHQLALLQHPPVQQRAPDGAAHPTVLIRRRAGQDRHPGMAGRQPGRGLPKVHRREEDISLAHPGPLLAEKVRVVGDMLRALRRQKTASLGGKVAVDLHMSALCLQLRGQRRIHLPGPVGQGRKHQHIAVPDLGRGLLSGHLQRPVLCPPVLHSGAAAPAGGGQVRHVTIPPDPSVSCFLL